MTPSRREVSTLFATAGITPDSGPGGRIRLVARNRYYLYGTPVHHSLPVPATGLDDSVISSNSGFSIIVI